jgi:hypothetical protein
MENRNMQTESKLNQAEVLAYSRSETDNLLAMYAQYMELTRQIENKDGLFSRTPGKIGASDLMLERKQLGEAMKFQNPLIWMMYKYEAYKNTSKPVLTTKMLREHCENKTDICFKRYDYINTALRQKNQGEDLNSDEFLAADTDLAAVINDQRFVNLALDPVFMAGWVKNENDEDGKWVNYKKV